MCDAEMRARLHAAGRREHMYSMRTSVCVCECVGTHALLNWWVVNLNVLGQCLHDAATTTHGVVGGVGGGEGDAIRLSHHITHTLKP